jgi:hypothetical protein
MAGSIWRVQIAGKTRFETLLFGTALFVYRISHRLVMPQSRGVNFGNFLSKTSNRLSIFAGGTMYDTCRWFMPDSPYYFC